MTWYFTYVMHRIIHSIHKAENPILFKTAPIKSILADHKLYSCLSLLSSSYFFRRDLYEEHGTSFMLLVHCRIFVFQQQRLNGFQISDPVVFSLISFIRLWYYLIVDIAKTDGLKLRHFIWFFFLRHETDIGIIETINHNSVEEKIINRMS